MRKMKNKGSRKIIKKKDNKDNDNKAPLPITSKGTKKINIYPNLIQKILQSSKKCRDIFDKIITV